MTVLLQSTGSTLDVNPEVRVQITPGQKDTKNFCYATNLELSCKFEYINCTLSMGSLGEGNYWLPAPIQ